MTPSFPYIISFLIGYLVLKIILKNSKSLPLSLTIILSLGLGLGLSGLLTFLNFLIVGQFNAFTIIASNLILLCILIFLNRTHLKPFKFSQLDSQIKKFNWATIAAVILWLMAFTYAIFLAYQHPYGDWDAWALWNTKMKFLTLGGENWHAIFDKISAHTQPDYPLLLPLINTWVYCFASAIYLNPPLITSLILTMCSSTLIYAGLRCFIKPMPAFCASLLCLASPYYVFKATAQYADTLFALYVLIIIILITLFMREKDTALLILVGLFLGLLAFTKNEGIAINLILLAPILSFVTFDKEFSKLNKKSLFLKLGIGLVLTGWAVIYFKIFLAPTNKDILVTSGNQSFSFFNLSGLNTIWSFIVKEFTDKRWFGIWFFICFLILLNYKKLFRRENLLLGGFFISYFSLLILIYLTTINFDLSWRLKSTLPRIFSYLEPSLLFFAFYLNFYESKSKSN